MDISEVPEWADRNGYSSQEHYIAPDGAKITGRVWFAPGGPCRYEILREGVITASGWGYDTRAFHNALDMVETEKRVGYHPHPLRHRDRYYYLSKKGRRLLAEGISVPGSVLTDYKFVLDGTTINRGRSSRAAFEDLRGQISLRFGYKELSVDEQIAERQKNIVCPACNVDGAWPCTTGHSAWLECPVCTRNSTGYP